jgi:glycosyltransferase involved in cell wall biosynthesis
MSNGAILIVANSSWNLVNFRAPILRALKDCGFEVVAAVPDDGSAEKLRAIGVEVHFVPVDAIGLSPARDLRLIANYRRLMQQIRPAALLAFTVKPNVYGSIVASSMNIPVINTITGLGTTFLSGRILRTAIAQLYRFSLQRSARVFFHNAEDRQLFVRARLIKPLQAQVVPGSGVNLEYFSPAEADASKRQPLFLFIGRFLRDKGALEFAEAASIVAKRTGARSQMLGSLEDHPRAVTWDLINPFLDEAKLEVHPPVEDVRPYIANADCVVLPSYREGLPRVLLEASAMAKPIIATDVPGCRQVVDHGVTGLLCQPRSSTALAAAMASIALMPAAKRRLMGKNARRKAERQFSEHLVVNAYIDAVKEFGRVNQMQSSKFGL